MSWNTREPKKGLVSSVIKSNYNSLDILFYSGFGTFDSTNGAQVTFKDYFLDDLPDSNYNVFITSVVKKGEAVFTTGKVWVEDLTPTGFKVYSDSSVGDKFTWILGGKK